MDEPAYKVIKLQKRSLVKKGKSKEPVFTKMPKLVLKASLHTYHNPTSHMSYVSSVPSSSMFVSSMSYPSASYTSSGLSQSYPSTTSKPSIRCAPISRVESSFLPKMMSSNLSYSSPTSSFLSLPSMTSSSSGGSNDKDPQFPRLDGIFYFEMLQKLKEQRSDQDQDNQEENLYFSDNKGTHCGVYSIHRDIFTFHSWYFVINNSIFP